MLKIEFEQPKHGWLPVKIIFGDIEICFHASNIPADPITQLENVLSSAIVGGGGEVWWHLEPAVYYLSLHAEKDLYRIKFEYADAGVQSRRETIFNYVGDFGGVIVPLWRSLRKLQSYNWPEFTVSTKTMESITETIKRKKIV